MKTVSVKQVHAFTIHRAPGHSGECTPAQAHGPQCGEHGDLSLTALTQNILLDLAGYSLRRAGLGCQQSPRGQAQVRLNWPHRLPLRSEEGYLTSGSVPHWTLSLGPETVLSLSSSP